MNSNNQKIARKKDRGGASCKYPPGGRLLYFDKDHQPRGYKCSRRAKKDGYCIFHHPEYWKEHPEEVRREFYDEVKHLVDKGRDVVCIGYNLPDIRVDEMGVKEFGLACFRKCNFQFADFADATFERADFAEATFENAIFHGKFKSADFTTSEFKSVPNFATASFESVDFVYAIFDKGAYFWKSTFREADFSKAILENADFQEACFESVVFSGAMFEKADLSGATAKSAFFRGAVFKVAHFFDVLLETADFSYSAFVDLGILKRAPLERYWNPQVKKLNKASKVEAEEKVDWKSDKYWSAFRNELGQAIESHTDQFLLFHLVTFRNPENITFIDFPLSNISFLMTDVTDIMIVTRAEEILSERLLRITEHNGEVTELRSGSSRALLKDIEPYLRYETVLAEYRNIRKSFEKKRTFAEASELFVREMRLVRQNAKNRDKAVLYLYDYLSKYGESYWRPIILSAVTILSFPLILSLLQLSLSLQGYLSNFADVIMAFFQMPIQNKALEITLRLISIVLLGNILVAFWRRVDRA